MYEKFIEILKIVIWPGIIFIAFLRFKKIFDYLFLSMKKFNFFGAQGELRDVQEVIEERVQQIITQQKEREELGETMRSLTAEVESQRVGTQELLKQYRKLYERNQELERKLIEKEMQVNALSTMMTKKETSKPLTVKELESQINSLLSQLTGLQRELSELEKGKKEKLNQF